MKFADLHLHTRFSDGTYSPQELISQAKLAGLSAIAIADHDTVEGVIPCLEEGAKEGIEVISGIELTAQHEGSEVHILGYMLDYKSPELLEKLSVVRKDRVERIYRITEKLKAMGLELDPQAVFAIAGAGTVGRLHVARVMVKEGLVGSVFEAFRKYIGDKCAAYVLGFRFTPAEAITLIKDSGGIPVLAHPYILNNDSLIPVFAGLGMRGLEVYYPEHSKGMINNYLKLAKENDLLVTGGSDCHGSAKPQVQIGLVKIPYELVEKMKEEKDARR